MCFWVHEQTNWFPGFLRSSGRWLQRSRWVIRQNECTQAIPPRPSTKSQVCKLTERNRASLPGFEPEQMIFTSGRGKRTR